MAKNTGKNYRLGAVNSRSQVLNTRTNCHVKRDTNNGQFIAVKSGTPFKGVRKEIRKK